MKQLSAFLLICFLVGCSSIEAPQTFTEQVAYAEAGAQATIKTIADLTCPSYVNGACTVTARPFSPLQAKALVQQIALARSGLKAAASLPDTGGQCLGETQTPVGCLKAAQAILQTVQTLLEAQK